MADFSNAPNLPRVNPNANANNLIQVKTGETRPVVEIMNNADPATVDINFTKAGAGPYDYQITNGTTGDNVPKYVYWYETIDGTGATACAQTVDSASADLDTRSGIDATVSFAASTMYALVVTTKGNLTILTLT